MLIKNPPSGLDVETILRHFSIITYMVDPDALRPYLPERFTLDCITGPGGAQKALISVVPFVDKDFRFVRFPWIRWQFGQTNYRVYVTDTQSGEHVVWFFGTSLDTIYVNIPRHIWKLPWHGAKIRFETRFDAALGRYTTYRLKTHSRWAPADLILEDSGLPPQELAGFVDLETALLLLTHPLRGYYYRRDGKIGSYKIWHDRLQMTEGQAVRAVFPLLDRLGLVRLGDLSGIHSVLLQPETEFTIYLPPVVDDQ